MARGPAPWGLSDATLFPSSAQTPGTNTTRRAPVAPGVAATRPSPTLEWRAECPAALYGGQPRPGCGQFTLGSHSHRKPQPSSLAARPMRGGAGGKTQFCFLSGHCGVGVTFGLKGSHRPRLWLALTSGCGLPRPRSAVRPGNGRARPVGHRSAPSRCQNRRLRSSEEILRQKRRCGT